MTHINELIDLTVSVYIVHKDKVLLINHKSLSMWLPVGGHVELHEDTDEALMREIKEECGLDVKIYGNMRKSLTNNSKPLRIPQFMEIHKIDDKHRHLDLVYFAYAKNNKAKLAEKEHNELKWFSSKNLVNKKFRIVPEIRFYARQALRQLSK